MVEQVFQASALVMADLRVLKDVAFMGVAMTAEQWVPLLQVSPRDLLPWLLNKHLQGYRCAQLPPSSSHALRATPDWSLSQPVAKAFAGHLEGVIFLISSTMFTDRVQVNACKTPVRLLCTLRRFWMSGIFFWPGTLFVGPG